MRNSIRRPRGIFAFSVFSVVWISAAHPDGVHDAGKLSQDAVAGGIDEAPMMLLDERIDQLAM
jgi:hypothetical protein